MRSFTTLLTTLLFASSAGLAWLAPAAALEPNDYVAQQLSLRQVRAQVAWDVETGGTSEVIVAILDSGIDHTHPDLAANIYNNAADACGNNADDDGNGFVDDCRGWDFVSNDNTANDVIGRGTHVAGTVGAIGDNGKGVAGISWSVKLMPVRVHGGGINDLTLDPDMAAKAVRYAADLGAHVIHISGHTTNDHQGFHDAIKYAVTKGALVVAAAGDITQNLDSKPIYPAAWNEDGFLSVAGIDQGGKLALTTNYGAATVDLSAPSIQVFSTMPGGLQARLSGTPMAAAHVTGAAALQKANQAAMTPVELAEKIKRTAGPRKILAGTTKTGAIVDMGLLISDKRDPVDATIDGPLKTETGKKVAFDGSNSEGQVIEYLWKFGDPIDQFGPVVVREWSRPGRIGLELQIRTADGRTATARHDIEVERKGAVACTVSPTRQSAAAFFALALLGMGVAMIRRRSVLVGLFALMAVPGAALAGPKKRKKKRRKRRKRRRRRRRRVRRRVAWRVVTGRRVLVVPLAIAIGWELALDDRVVVVREVHDTHIIVVEGDGEPEKVDITKEDTDENKVELEGTEYEEEVEDDEEEE